MHRQLPQTSKYNSIQQAIKCAYWKMLQAIKAQGGSLATTLGGSTECGGKILSNGQGQWLYTGYTSWNVEGPSSGALNNLAVPAGWTAYGNYHTHTYRGSLGWGFSSEDFARRGSPKSEAYYSSIVTPDRNNEALLGWVLPGQTAETNGIQTLSTPIAINGEGCK